jgi:uncharacterized protein Yka (UPF0111/DUF47 family)
MKHHWFLPETPDVIGILCRQAQATIDGMDALSAWAGGDASAAERVRDLEHAADTEKWTLRRSLTDAFTTPVDAEDLYVMSERLDAVMNGAKDAVREAEVMALPPDEAIAEMAECLAQGVRHLADAFRGFDRKERTGGRAAATDAATAAIRSQRDVEKAYRRAMSGLLAVDDLREVIARREMYRRFSRISEALNEAADRVWYAAVKEA